MPLYFLPAALWLNLFPTEDLNIGTLPLWMDPQGFTSSNSQGNGLNASFGLTPNVTRVAGKFGAGPYGAQISTIQIGNDTLGGFIINADVNGNGIKGGIPYSQKPTGIRFYYKYATSGVDTAAVLVFFKKSGSIIDSFLVQIPSSAATGTYTLHSYHPLFPLPLTPDTVIVGAVSSKALITNHNYNKGIIPGSTFTIDSVNFTGATQPANLNGDFENWNTDTLNYPMGWYVSYPGETRSTDYEAGVYSLQLSTVNTPNIGVTVGQASTGYYPQNCNGFCHQMGGKAYTLKTDTLEFWYKYFPVSTDTANVGVNFIQNGNNINCCTGISLYGTVSSWTYVKIPFSYGTSPDTAIVSIACSQHNHDSTSQQYLPYVGTILRIDGLTFASQKASLGINNVKPVDGIRVYPNPASTQVNIDLSDVSGSLQTLAIYDLSGRMISSKNYNGIAHNTIETMDISSLASGMYLVEVTTDSGKLIQKVCKQ